MQALTAVEVLDTLNASGLVLTLTADNGLKVTPASAITDLQRLVIGTHKAILVAHLQQEAANDPPTEAERELIEERAAIMEFDGGMARPQAETLARLHTHYLLHHFACKTCCAAGQGRGLRCPTGAALWSDYDDVAERQQHPQQKRKHA